MDAARLAEEMFAECVAAGQSARRVTAGSEAAPVRAALRALGRERHVRVRTALMDDVVVVARVDADLWNDDGATMRAKLTPPAS